MTCQFGQDCHCTSVWLTVLRKLIPPKPNPNRNPNTIKGQRWNDLSFSVQRYLMPPPTLTLTRNLTLTLILEWRFTQNAGKGGDYVCCSCVYA